MSEQNIHEMITGWLRALPTSGVSLGPGQASDLLDEWEDAQAMILALNDLVATLSTQTEAPPAWTVIA